MSDDPRPPSAAAARAEVEARRDADRRAVEAAFIERNGPDRPGRGTVVVDAVATAVLVVAAVAAAAAPSTFVAAYFVVSLLWFLAGSFLFAAAMVRAAGRSRGEEVAVAGLFLMAGSTPSWARRQLLGLLAVQVVAAVAAAAVRPFTPVAFGTLAPMLGLGFCGWWTARFGVFRPRGGAAGRSTT